MIGINFQPGMSGYSGSGSRSGNGGNSNAGVQEAIKVLSLRLPKVVGAQGIAPQALLSSQGSGGSRVDSVVNTVLGRMFPSGQQEASAPSFGTAPSSEPAPYQMPNFSGSHSGPQAQTYAGPTWNNPWSTIPKIIAGGDGQGGTPQNPYGPPGVGDFMAPIGGFVGSQEPRQPAPPPSQPSGGGLFGGSPYESAPPERYEQPSI